MSDPQPFDGKPVPLRGDVWRHYKGGHYVVLAVAVDVNNPSREEDRYVVVYRAIGSSQIFARAEAEFLEDVDGSPRFTLDYRREGVGDQVRT